MNSKFSGAPLSRREFVRASLKLGAALAVTGGLSRNTRAAAGREAWQIGCYTRPWDKYDWREAFDAIAEAGYRWVGLMTTHTKEWVMLRHDMAVEEAHRMAEEARKRKLQVVSAYGTFTATGVLARGIQELKQLIDNCAAAGSPNLLLGGVAEPRLYEPYYQTIAECCGYAAAKGVGLSIKPHGGLNATGPQCRKAIEKVACKQFGLWYDPGNIFYYSDGALDPVSDAASVDGLVVGMSVKDYRPPKEVMVTPGTGKVDFAKVFARLKQGGFTGGPLVVECLQPGDRAQITAEARKAREFLERLTGQRG